MHKNYRSTAYPTFNPNKAAGGVPRYSAIPTEGVVTSLDDLRKYVGPQTDEPPKRDGDAILAAAKARALQDRLVFARGTVERFATILRALDVPGDSPEALLRDELLSILADHGYVKA